MFPPTITRSPASCQRPKGLKGPALRATGLLGQRSIASQPGVTLACCHHSLQTKPLTDRLQLLMPSIFSHIYLTEADWTFGHDGLVILQSQGCISIARHFQSCIVIHDPSLPTPPRGGCQHTLERTPSPANTYVTNITQSKANICTQPLRFHPTHLN
ncbi:3-5 exonuclease protein [Fusarium oxysporum f. sp. albedinis]|nr:3-5 exonuclease protein [Fusarium oxysporum f. sp. albedinis]